MDNKLRELREDVRCKTLHSRGIDALIATDRFERLWDDSTSNQREEITLLVQFGFKSKAMAWVKAHPSLDLGERSINYLRERGKSLRIRNYSRLSKSELLTAIIKQEEHETHK